MLAKNHAFLDQPNASSKDPLQTIGDDDLREEIFQELEQLELSSKNRKHLMNLRKKEQNVQREILKGTSSKNLDVQKLSLDEKKQHLEKMKKEEKKIKKGLSYFHNIVNGKTDFLGKDQQKGSKLSPEMIMKEAEGFSSLDELEIMFDLPEVPGELSLEDSKTVTGLYPGRGFFYLPKTTSFDRDWVPEIKVGIVFERALKSPQVANQVGPQLAQTRLKKQHTFYNSIQDASTEREQHLQENIYQDQHQFRRDERVPKLTIPQHQKQNPFF